MAYINNVDTDELYPIEYTTADGKAKIQRMGIYGLRFLIVDDVVCCECTVENYHRLLDMGTDPKNKARLNDLQLALILKRYME